MELDELKYYLKNTAIQAPIQTKSAESLTALLKNNPKSPVNKIKRSLIIEIAITVAMLPVFVAIILKCGIWSLQVYFAVLSLLCVWFSLKLYTSYKRIQLLNNTVLPVKKNLEEVYYTMKSFVKRYFQLTMASLPIFFIFSFLLGFYEGYTGISIPFYEDLLSKYDNISQVIWFTVLYMTILSIGMYFFTKWYLKKLYGDYLKELESLLAELDN